MGTRRWKRILLAGFLLAALAPAEGGAASFDCDAAKQPDEIAICANRDLDDADVEMATRYAMLMPLLPMGSAAAMRDEQKAWLAWRHACGGDVRCLRAAYKDRIAALTAAFERIVSLGPF